MCLIGLHMAETIQECCLVLCQFKIKTNESEFRLIETVLNTCISTKVLILKFV